MSFLYKKVAAQDGNSEFIIEHSRIPIAQLGGVENAKKSGYIVAKKNGRTYGVHIDGYSDELTRRTLKDAGYAFDECEGEDAAEFKVGDKIWVDPSYGANLNIGYGWNVGIVKRVSMGNIDVDFKGQVISVPAPYCARVNSSGKPVFDSAAQDRGDYYTNSEALLRMALGNLRNASRVVRQATSNISNAMVKVKDEQTKGFLKGIYQSWARCYKEFEDVIHEAEMIAIPTAYGIPHKEKIPPEERDLLKEFFE